MANLYPEKKSTKTSKISDTQNQIAMVKIWQAQKEKMQVTQFFEFMYCHTSSIFSALASNASGKTPSLSFASNRSSLKFLFSAMDCVTLEAIAAERSKTIVLSIQNDVTVKKAVKLISENFQYVTIVARVPDFSIFCSYFFIFHIFLIMSLQGKK